MSTTTNEGPVTFFRGEDPLKASKLNLAFSERVLRTGDTMLGKLVLAMDPTAPFDAVTKQYLDRNFIYSLNAAYLQLAGGTMQGYIKLHADPSAPMDAATRQYVDSKVSSIGAGIYLPLVGGTLTGPLNLSADPITASLQAATKAYVDTKESAIAAGTTAQYWRGDKTWVAFPAIPAASSTLPIIEGTAAVGVSTTYARADHVHPSTAGGAFLTDAPSDNKAYSRRNATWTSNPFYDARGNVGFGILPPATQAPASASGSWLFAWGLTSDNVASGNTFWNGTGWAYVANGFASVMQQYGGEFHWMTAPTGLVGAAAVMTERMYLSNTGNLTVTGGLTTTNIFANGVVYPSAPQTGPNGYALFENSGTRYMRFTTDNWHMRWQSDGSLVYGGPDNDKWYVNSAGEMWCRASFSSGGNVTVNNRLFCQDIMNSSGVFFVANDYNYYLQRTTDGNWNFVEGGVNKLQIHSNGYVYPQNGLITGGYVYANAIWAGSGPAGTFGLLEDATFRYISFASPWVIRWDKTNGDMLFGTSYGWSIVIRTSDMLVYNNSAAMGGFGAYNNLSDERGKTSIAPADAGLAEVLKIVPISYNRLVKDTEGGVSTSPRTELGFSAQQLLTALPEAVTVFGAELPDGTGGLDTDAPSLGIQSEMITAALVNAIKQLTDRIVVLEARLV